MLPHAILFWMMVHQKLSHQNVWTAKQIATSTEMLDFAALHQIIVTKFGNIAMGNHGHNTVLCKCNVKLAICIFAHNNASITFEMAVNQKMVSAATVS